jgi:serine O-acetyltransferase
LLSYLDPKLFNIEAVVQSFYESLETIYNNLRLDAVKIFEFDPAASSVNEVIVSYPGFYAITVYCARTGGKNNQEKQSTSFHCFKF